MNDQSLPQAKVRLWASLRPGDSVDLVQAGRLHYSGVVDDRNRDGSIVWVVDRLGQRRLFHITDDFDLRVRSSTDETDASQRPSERKRIEDEGKRRPVADLCPGQAQQDMGAED